MHAEPSAAAGGAAASGAVAGGAAVDRIDRAAVAEAVRWSAGGLMTLLAAAAAALVWRRLAGALLRPLDPPILLLAGLTFAAATFAARRVLGRRPYLVYPSKLGRLGLVLLPSLCVVGMAAALTLPAARPVGVAGLWALVAVEEVFAWRAVVRGRPDAGQWVQGSGFRVQGSGAGDQEGAVRREADRRACDAREAPERRLRAAGFVAAFSAGAAGLVGRFRSSAARAGSSAQPEVEEASLGEPRQQHSPEAVLLGAVEDVPGEEVLQQLVRSQAADGSEQVAGWLRMPLAAGQRTGSVHVAFCPPFARTPEVRVEQVDGPPARIKTAQLLPFGVRLDVRLAAAAEGPAGLLLRFNARSPGGA